MKLLENLQYSDSEDCKLDVYLPVTPNKTAFVYFHGGGLEGGDKKDTPSMYRRIADFGTTVISVNYRMYPGAAYPEFIEDCANSVKWAFEKAESLGYEKIVIGGSSAGAYLSMMLCFDERYLRKAGVIPDKVAGYIFDAGQPTTHFRILKERGLDPRRIIVDEAAPLYYVEKSSKGLPMLIFIAENDMPGRYEQTQLLLSTMKHFEYDPNKITYKFMKGKTHCSYEDDRAFSDSVIEFIRPLVQ